MSKGQTFRSEDNAFLPLRRRHLSVRCVTTLSKIEAASQASKKTLKLNASVSLLLQVLPLAQFLTAQSGFRLTTPIKSRLQPVTGARPSCVIMKNVIELSVGHKSNN